MQQDKRWMDHAGMKALRLAPSHLGGDRRNTVQQQPKHGRLFWLGNAVLALAAVFLLFIDQVAQWLGTGAMALWMGMAALGVYLIVKDGGK
ncbi:hypothetical protein Ga0061069_11121 [Thiomonas bhubaneswarensis]|uniref:Uncharacterized protein n=1 Tax=Thiomonas bhubaneswarensis TaxID=339866 RepID=A0A0K6IA49_9BURK|nr:hypothetical protein Ga0061069_11121 [Thiomonas bhubaneswarensis]